MPGDPASREDADSGAVSVESPSVPAGPVSESQGYRKGSVLVDWLSSTYHKVIGHLYLITSFGFL